MSDYAIKQALSESRLGTFEAATKGKPILPCALALYAWNAQVAAAMLAPLHLCEVVLRNAVSDALESVYGHRWPWSAGFVQSLPDPATGYNPRRDLVFAREGRASPGKVIAELPFFFWQNLFTKRFELRLWSAHLFEVMPYLDKTQEVSMLRRLLFDELEQVRKLRNRIAHHEPVFKRNLEADFQRISWLIGLRSPETTVWMTQNQQVLSLLSRRPP